VLLYGSETGTVKERYGSRITVAEIKYMRRTAGYIWTDHKPIIQIANESKITSFRGKITRIQEKLDTTCKQKASQ
jgi:hypothetical protein